MISFQIPGEPIPKGRPRFSHGRVFTPKRTVEFENLVGHYSRLAMAGRPPIPDAVELDVTCVFEPPASWSGKKKQNALDGVIKHTTRPDADNLLKAIGDGVQGIVFENDSAVCIAHVKKIYGLEAMTVVNVRPI